MQAHKYFPFVLFPGNAYALDGGCLMHAPIALSGAVVEDQWAIVENVDEVPGQIANARALLQELNRRQYRIKWFNYPSDPKPQTKPISWFTDDQGFDRQDQACIMDLDVGATYTCGMGETVEIERTPNAADCEPHELRQVGSVEAT